MRLQDEYIKRHGLKYLPVYHTKQASVILKDTRPRIVLTIQWEDSTRNPGYYIFRYLAPNHNGYLDGNYFLQQNEDRYYQYDEYLNIIQGAQAFSLRPVRFSQIRLAIWEIFLYCFDAWIAEMNLEEMIFDTMNPTIPSETRIMAIDAILQHFERHNTLIFKTYNSEFKKYENNYADWFVELIESHSKEDLKW